MSEHQTTPTADDTARNRGFYLGAVIAAVGVVFVPFLLAFVAVPESILNLLGAGSIQDRLPKDARGNPYVSGSFLIFRWFGNFLIAAFVIGAVIGVMLVV